MEELTLGNINAPERAEWWRRLLGWLIDFFPIWILSIARPDMQLVFFVLIYIPYCIILEGVFNRTLGKLITGTVVISSKTFEKPSFGQILGRSFSRLIPFDGLSFISGKPRGWHDSIPNTLVTTVKSKRIYKTGSVEINYAEGNSKTSAAIMTKAKWFNKKLITIPLNQTQKIIYSISIFLIAFILAYVIAEDYDSDLLLSNTWGIWIIFILVQAWFQNKLWNSGDSLNITFFFPNVSHLSNSIKLSGNSRNIKQRPIVTPPTFKPITTEPIQPVKKKTRHYRNTDLWTFSVSSYYDNSSSCN